MALGKVVLNLPALEVLLHTPSGPVAGALMFVAEEIVQETKVNLSVPWIRGTRGRNPPPGPPKARTRDLLNSVHFEPPVFVDGRLTVRIVADAVHRGWYYGEILRDRGYQFVDLDKIKVFLNF